MTIDPRPSTPFPDQPRVGERWAYCARAAEPLVEVVVLKIGEKRPPRVLVRFVDDAFEGHQEWVPPGRLKAPWHHVDAYNEWDRRWDAILVASPGWDDAEESAASVIFDLLVDRDVAALGYNASRGVVKIRDLGRLAAYLDVDESAFNADPLSFEEDGCLVAPWPTTKWIAAMAAARHPDVVMADVAKEEADARREASIGRHSRPINRFDDGFTPPEVCAEIDDEHGKPVRAVLRSWCGEEAVTLRDELGALREELRRVSAIAESAAAALRERGSGRDAARTERALGIGIGSARRPNPPARLRPPRAISSDRG